MGFLGFGNKISRQTKSINARIKKLRKAHAKAELRGCLCDAELKAKEIDLDVISQEIRKLQIEREKLWAKGLSKRQKTL